MATAGSKAIRRASTVLLMAPDHTISHTLCVPYKLLFMRRSSKASFMKNIHVFPGGVVDAADLHFESAAAASLASNWRQPQSPVAAVAAASAAHLSHPLPTLPAGISDSVSDRLAALREVFEECGVLLARPPPAASTQVPVHDAVGTHLASVCTAFPSAAATEAARTASSADAHAFFSACNQLGVVPDTGALLPYTRWVTPPFESRRFDTWFYLCALPTPPDALGACADNAEVTTSQWLTPRAALELHAAGSFALAPPTVYVLTEMAALPTMDLALAHARRRITSAPHLLRPTHVSFNFREQPAQPPASPSLPVAQAAPIPVYSALPGDPTYPQPHPEADAATQTALDDGALFPQMRRHRIVKHERPPHWSVEIEHESPSATVVAKL